VSAHQQAKPETLANSAAAKAALEFWNHSQTQAEWRRKRERAGVSPSKLDAIKGRIERLRSRAAAPSPHRGAPPKPRAIPSHGTTREGDSAPFQQAREIPAWLVNGQAVWFQVPLPAGLIRFIRCQATDRRDLMGRVFVMNIDDPKHQFYASPRNLRQRFKGEVAPGAFPQNPNGDDAA